MLHKTSSMTDRTMVFVRSKIQLTGTLCIVLLLINVLILIYGQLSDIQRVSKPAHIFPRVNTPHSQIPHATPLYLVPLDRRGSITIRVEDSNEICKIHSNHHDKAQYHVVMRQVSCTDDSLGNLMSDIFIGALKSFEQGATFEYECPNGPLHQIVSNKTWASPSPFQQSTVRTKDVCESCGTYSHTCRHGLNHGIGMIQEIMRFFPKPNPDSIDDLSIHLRCGDVLQYQHHIEYGYPKYSLYREILQPYLRNISTIGIVTTPFDKKRARFKDIPFLQTCHQLVHDLADYLSDSLYIGNVHDNEERRMKVSIRNDESAYATMGRLVNSPYVWCNPSSYCLYPALASIGQSFIVKSSKLYPFIEEIVDHPNIHVVGNNDFLSMNHIVTRGMNPNQIIEWLRSN